MCIKMPRRWCWDCEWQTLYMVHRNKLALQDIISREDTDPSIVHFWNKSTIN